MAGLAAAGQMFSGVSSIVGGIAAKRSADSEADQLRRKAGARRAEGVAGAIEERRQGRLNESRARAVAAASGAGVTDPTVVNLMGDIQADADYRALSRMYEGEEEAAGLDAAAKARKREGRAARLAGGLKGVGSILSGVDTLRSKYGDG